MPGEDCHDHRQPPRVDASADTPRHREIRTSDERLDLEQQRPRPFERTRDGGPDLAGAGAPEERGRSGTP